MCQWRQWLPNNFDRLSSYCATSPATGVSFLLRWMWRCSVLCCPPSWRVSIMEDLSVQYDTEALHGSLFFIKANLPPCALCLSTCPFSTRPRTRSGLGETLAFELLFCHFLLLENRERRGEYWPTFLHLPQPSIQPSARTGWVHTLSYPYSVHDYNQAASQTLLVRQLERQGTPTLSSGLSFKVRVPLPVQFFSSQNHSCIHNNTRSLEFKKKKFS